jgi:hypothetical protein
MRKHSARRFSTHRARFDTESSDRNGPSARDIGGALSPGKRHKTPLLQGFQRFYHSSIGLCDQDVTWQTVIFPI